MNNSKMVLVPRALLGAVASALETGNPAQNTLASVREYYLESDAEIPHSAEVTLRAIAQAAGLDLSAPLPEGELSKVLVDALRGGRGIDLDAADFSDALMWLKEGKCIRRAGWNGVGQFVYRIQGDKLAKALSYGFGEYLNEPTFGDMLVLRNAQNLLSSWVPSIGDLMATDWQVVSG